MNIDKMIKNFLENDKLAESSKPIYENVLMVFAGYFREHNCDLNKLTYINIFEGLDFYIKERKIKFENTARFYIRAVKDFIIYYSENADVKNMELLSLFGLGGSSGGFEDKVDKRIYYLINNKTIKQEKSGIEIDSKELKDLVDKCDEIIDKFKVKDLKTKIYNGSYTEYIGALGVKIISYTGIKVGLLMGMKLDSILPKEGYLRIENVKRIKGKIKEVKSFDFKIPRKLYKQLINYRDNIRKELLLYKNNEETIIEYLFIDYMVRPITMKTRNKPFNDLIFNVVSTNKEMASATAIVSKRAIIDMISAGMSLKMIEDLTGYGETVIQYCKEKADQIKREEKDPNEYIDKFLEKRSKENKYYDVFN